MAPSTKPVLHPLKTPKTATFPSEIIARLDPKSDISMSTPITPPVAYTEFLKALTPAFHSPISPAMSFSRYPIEKVPASISQPSTATSVSFPNGGEFVKSATSTPGSPADPPLSAKSPNGRKRLRISTAKASRKGMSPVTDSPRSATTVSYSPYSPADWKLRYFDGPRNPPAKSVSVRQVVTRTVTYKQTSLEPPPKGKRRRTGVTSQS